MSVEEDHDDFIDDEGLFEHHRVVVDPGQQLYRIDKFLMEKLPNASRNKIQQAIKDGFVLVNEKAIKPNYKIRPEDTITVSLPEPPRNDEIIPEDIPIHIVFEDEDLLIINKEPGMVVHPAYKNWNGTLVNALCFHLENLPTGRNGTIRPGLVHRIDKDTSGLMVIAKHEASMTALAKQFFDHSIERTYNALVWGDLKEDQGTITGHVGRSLNNRKVMAVFPDGSYGKHAVTHYRVLRRFGYVTFVECKLETGRTHQIRAHMKHLGHPLFNDATYGGDRILSGEVFSKYKQFVQNTFDTCPRQALHAKTLGFIHPSMKKPVFFDSEIPSDMSEALARWEKYGQQH